MVFEAVAPSKESLEETLQDHVEKLDSDEGVEVVEREFDDPAEVENPHPNLEKGFSQVAETQVEFEDFGKAVNSVVNYGPTYVQMESPDNYNMKLAEGQEALQKIANTMHQYAQMGAGGVLVSREGNGSE